MWPMFVAFTGYARIATLAKEMRDPTRNIPRAIVVTPHPRA
jgi:APA family basic amino acid/polyamine antiporter